MLLLLDTHVLLWWLADHRQLRASWREKICDPSVRVLVSAASIWEIAIKQGLGKLQLELPRTLSLAGLAGACAFDDLPVTAEHAAAVLRLPAHHTDPFDRLIVAQATCENAILVSADEVMIRYAVPLLE